MDLNFNNYFSVLIFSPSRAKVEDHDKCVCITIALTLFSAFTIPVVVGLFWLGRSAVEWLQSKLSSADEKCRRVSQETFDRQFSPNGTSSGSNGNLLDGSKPIIDASKMNFQYFQKNVPVDGDKKYTRNAPSNIVKLPHDIDIAGLDRSNFELEIQKKIKSLNLPITGCTIEITNCNEEKMAILETQISLKLPKDRTFTYSFKCAQKFEKQELLLTDFEEKMNAFAVDWKSMHKLLPVEILSSNIKKESKKFADANGFILHKFEILFNSTAVNKIPISFGYDAESKKLRLKLNDSIFLFCWNCSSKNPESEEVNKTFKLSVPSAEISNFQLQNAKNLKLQINEPFADLFLEGIENTRSYEMPPMASNSDFGDFLNSRLPEGTLNSAVFNGVSCLVDSLIEVVKDVNSQDLNKELAFYANKFKNSSFGKDDLKPMLASVVKSYYHCSRALHPDKHQNKEDQFKELNRLVGLIRAGCLKSGVS